MKRVITFLIAAAAFAGVASVQPAPTGADVHGRYTIAHDYRPSPSLSRTGWLSDYYPGLLGTPGDSRVYYFEGRKPGGTLFIGGGTHANEIAGIMAAVVAIENLRVDVGRVIVVPNLNSSGVSHLDKEPSQPDYTTVGPAWIRLKTPSGVRFFKYGSRCTNLAHQGVADPDGGYVHPDSEEEPLAAWEFRNLNRAYPGATDSGLTQKIAYAVMLLLRSERVSVAFDYHEADIGGRLANMMVAHPKNIDIAAAAAMDVDLDFGLSMKLEPSNLFFRGLSHREWGSGSDALSFLTESAHPGMGQGSAADTDVVDDPRSPLGSRVALHLACTEAVVRAYNQAHPDASIVFSGLPGYEALVADGVGPFLK
ncbi:MAG: succinylglutamate desuccinylase/aspartoacylase family protein [Spirochaetes bacterium]|nr:succinylglutamate desuccinylase/aspartoacylase family protein [Spirochaetota bacterium]MBU1081599.1 succinylglutamate desuccinylase/aspartoacylase family protein [Spirochaetota bacterium]